MNTESLACSLCSAESDLFLNKQWGGTIMTEREKMLAGIPYCSADKELRVQSNKAKALIKEYNNLSAEDMQSRTTILNELFEHCGKDVRVNQPLYVDYGCNISIGDNSFINMNCTLLDTNKIIIGKRTLLAPDVKIYTATHPKRGSERYTKQGEKWVLTTLAQPVKIGDDVWIGGGAIILPGVTIGNNTIIGAGSVVTKDIPDNVIAVGNPCRIIGKNE